MKQARLEAIPGWFWQSDRALFDWFLDVQVVIGQRGDLAELGPYMGKSAVLIGDHVLDAETFTVIDLFDMPAADEANQVELEATYGDCTQAAFESNYQRVHGKLPRVIKGYSQDIDKHASHDSHRFVHIDASHLYDHVKCDLAAVRNLMQSDGIVALDDIRSCHTPGVWAAAWEAVIVDGLRPVAVTEHKMYATWGDAELWQQRLMSDLPQTLCVERQSVLGRPLLRIWSDEFRPPVTKTRRLIRGLTPPAIVSCMNRLRAKMQ